MNFIFLMDPLSTVKMEKDTSFIIMLGAHRRGHKVFYLGDGDIVLENGKLHFNATRVIPQRVKSAPFIIKEKKYLSENNIDVVFVRNDPPFDERYLHNMWLLDLLPAHIPIMNSPGGIRTVNEKIWASQFKGLVPPTFIGSWEKGLKAFIKKHGEVIAKPTNSYGGQNVFRVKYGDTNTNVILEALTENGRRDIILQKYVKAASNGDKRILLLNGETLGAVLRVHAKGEHRNNFFAGGTAKKTHLTLRDNQIVHTLKPYLQSLGLYFVGIDVIGDHLIEVNVTSPTCLQEMNALYGARLEEKVIDFAQMLIAQGLALKGK